MRCSAWATACLSTTLMHKWAARAREPQARVREPGSRKRPPPQARP
ncbi:MAG TPA: hypothetical protein VKT82_32315 [Ktedonobacterales bacterium]|nr:hypothetical protein [Ktedonobacterales bacterium]